VNRVLTGDAIAMMATLPASSIDAIATDPPYGLNLLGHDWDHGVPGVPYWEAAYRVAKPGAFLAAFGGTRTHHRLMCAIEDAGWELRDCLQWLFAEGMPKGSTIKNGRGTTLKPGYEPIILARKPPTGTVAVNAVLHGTGALNIEACRIAVAANDAKGGPGYSKGRSGRKVGATRRDAGALELATKAGNPLDGKGRWPANVLIDDEVAALLDAQSGVLKSGKVTKKYGKQMESSVAFGDKRRVLHPGMVFSDEGGASRFFTVVSWGEDELRFRYVGKASRSERTHGGKVENWHPTVKPRALMRWLLRLITPPGGTVLDPFCGSGSTLVAALDEGLEYIGIDNDPRSARTARARLAVAGREQRA
jgi:site-specific DNA-methyltransferase (adenine-specific)